MEDTAVALPRPHLRSASTTIAALAERFLREYVDVYLKPRTGWNYHHYMAKFILPKFGKRDFRQVSRSDVQALHTGMKDNKAAADYVLCVLGSLYSRIIEDWELADIRNPVDGARRYGSREVERFLTPEERRRLQTVLEAGLRLRPGTRGSIEPMTVWALQLLALTGLRRDEILDLKWSMVDWQHALFNLPDTKTGQRSVRVSRPVMDVLREIRQHSSGTRNGHVITSRTGGRLKSLNRSWERIRVVAGIPDVRLHDLRHSFASDAIMGGVPLAVVGKLLGHRQASTTERYAHIADKVVQDAVEHTAARIADAVKPALVLPPPPPPFKALSNAQWAKVAPIVCAGRNVRTQAQLRKAVDGVRWVLHHNASWREIPREYGSSTTCWRWHARWQADGTWTGVAAALG
ncbi:tyrosine-type recombinase/integrase [Nannocystis pusilla]|uniref:tyrosine-type recombinase/integrase n=1 Tax=Nannocystis pusilla TaxID=889268 RepID=UPI003B7C1E44